MGVMADPKFVTTCAAGDKVMGVKFSITHGKGNRYEIVRVPISDVLRAADAYRGCVGDAAYSGDDGHNAGHAMWHIEHPDSPIPCSENAARSQAPDLAQLVRNYFGACDRLADYTACAASDKGFQEQVIEITRQRDEALAAMRKASK